MIRHTKSILPPFSLWFSPRPYVTLGKFFTFPYLNFFIYKMAKILASIYLNGVSIKYVHTYQFLVPV